MYTVTGVAQLTGSHKPDHLLGLKEIPNVWFLSHSSKRSFSKGGVNCYRPITWFPPVVTTWKRGLPSTHQMASPPPTVLPAHLGALEPPVRKSMDMAQMAMSEPSGKGQSKEGTSALENSHWPIFKVSIVIPVIPHFIINPGYPVFARGVLLECKVFVVDSKFSQLQHGSEESCVHRLGQAIC